MLVVNPNNQSHNPFAAIEPPLWAGLIAGYYGCGLLDAEGHDLSIDETEQVIRRTGQSDVLIVVMGTNPSVSSTPKMPVAERLADRIADLNVSLTGLHPIAAGSRYPVVPWPFEDTPTVPWRKLPMGKYMAHNWQCLDGSPRSPYASVYTSLGCPFDCFYCNVHTLYGGRQVTLRPLTDVIEEIRLLNSKYGVRNIKIWDELFTLNEDRVIEICAGVRRFDLNMWAYARLDSVTPKMLRAMKAAGMNWLAYGFESVKDKKLIARADDVIRATHEAGISIIANFMFGLPGTTREDDHASVEYAMRHCFEYVNFYDAKPYPGSRWYEDAKPVDGWESYDQHKNRSAFRQGAFERYFTNPVYLSMIQFKWGNQAVDHINGMLKWRPQLQEVMA